MPRSTAEEIVLNFLTEGDWSQDFVALDEELEPELEIPPITPPPPFSPAP